MLDAESSDRAVKRHACLLGHPKDRMLWVGDEEDWARMKPEKDKKTEEKPTLVCPHEGCSVPLVAVDGQKQRFLRFAAGDGCGHWGVREGGEESPRHLWMKARIARIVQSLGYQAIPEHPTTKADVYVPTVAWAIEIQLRNTEFEKRTDARRRAGASTLWLLPPDQSTTTDWVSRGVFDNPGARFVVVDRRHRRTAIAPWDDPSLNPVAWLMVFGTVFHLRDEPPYLVSGRTDGKKFLNDVLRGELHWYPKNTSEWPRDGHRPPGGWAHPADLAEAIRRQRAARARAARQASVKAAPTVVSPPPSGGETNGSEHVSLTQSPYVRVHDDHMFTVETSGTAPPTCRVQLFVADGNRPIVVATQLREEGMCRRNCDETFAAEVWRRLLPNQSEPPVWVEHLPDEEPHYQWAHRRWT